jgi:hypothetical protein
MFSQSTTTVIRLSLTKRFAEQSDQSKKYRTQNCSLYVTVCVLIFFTNRTDCSMQFVRIQHTDGG